METRWLYNTTETLADLREASEGVCVIPMGCIEKHGLHLPLGTDILQASRIAYMASQLETFCVFPDFPLGDVPNPVPNGAYGSVATQVEMEMLLLDQLCKQISLNGFKKILVYNGHGGNTGWLAAYARNIENKWHDNTFVWVMLALNSPHTLAEILIEKGSGSIPEINKEDEELLLKYHEQDMAIGHGGFGETSYMMGISPENVHFERLGIESGKPTGAGKALHLDDAGLRNGDSWALEYPNSFCGDDPIGCNERIGKAALRIEAERLAQSVAVYKKDTALADRLKKRQKGWEQARL